MGDAERERERAGEGDRDESQLETAGAPEVELQAGEEEEEDEPDLREDPHGLVHLGDPEHGGADQRSGGDLGHDRRHAPQAQQVERERCDDGGAGD